jgi:hypothetical protein
MTNFFVIALMAFSLVALAFFFFFQTSNECSGMTSMECQYFKANVSTLASYNNASYSESKAELLSNSEPASPIGFFVLGGK